LPHGVTAPMPVMTTRREEAEEFCIGRDGG
jgi:hypothetical protein